MNKLKVLFMVDYTHKILSADKDGLGQLAQNESKVVICYGHFNVIHPGHMRYLKYAKTLGDYLVVALQDDYQLQGNTESKNYFSQEERAEALSSLHIIDNVVMLDNGNLEEFVELVKPRIMVLGSEHEQQADAIVKNAILKLESNNGKIIYHAGDTHYANTDLFHINIDELEQENITLFKKACRNQKLDVSQLLQRIKKIAESKILVIGDNIVDQYVGCDALGMSSEAPVLVVRELESKEYLGGAAIVASHVRALGAQCHYISVIGEDVHADYVCEKLKASDVETHFFRDESRPTTYKIRYMVESQKLFRVSRLKEHKISTKVEDFIIKKINELSPGLDGIIISDFVYGVITGKVIQSIKKIAGKYNIKIFADVQCSSQIGSVLKFNEFDLVFPTEKEARIALDNNAEGIEWVANKLMDELSTKEVLVKLGSEGFIAYSKQSDNFILRQHFPALTINPVDVTGAGDSMMAAMAGCISSGGDLMEASAIGACMASLAVREIGNTPINKNQLSQYMKYVSS